MALTLTAHFALIEAEAAVSRDAPLSARRALLALCMIDVFADRVFAAHGSGSPAVSGADDILAYRAELRAACPALGTIADLCAGGDAAPRLRITTVAVPIADYPGLGVEDFMVSLYNGNAVQRLMLVSADGERLVQAVLDEAVAWWRTQAGT